MWLKFFCYMGNRAHDLGTNRLAHRNKTLYHYTKSISRKQVHQYIVATPTYEYTSSINDFNQQKDKIGAKATNIKPIL